ncbi:DUF374 domain-containing protein [bacterium]|nr:DUF374 domain-containing protein [bacterium]
MTECLGNARLLFMNIEKKNPLKLFRKNRFLASFGIFLYKLYISTWRLKRIHPWWKNTNIDPDRPIIFATWHEDDFTLIGLNRNRGYITMVSLSRDGELMDYALKKLKYRTCRGSSSRGGARALLSMIRMMRKIGFHGILAVDGPRGPRHQAKPGLVAIAYKLGAQIITLSKTASRRYIIKKSWSHAYIPLPFARVIHCFSEFPIAPPKDNSPEAFAKTNDKIEQQLIDDHSRINEMLGEKF